MIYRKCDYLDLLKEMEKESEKAWSQMGSPGDDDYWEKATKEEIYNFGRYRVLEDLRDE